MTPKVVHSYAVRLQDLRDQQTEFAIAQHGHFPAPRDLHLIEDLAGSRQWLRENSTLNGKAHGYDVQVSFGKSQKVAKRAGVFQDAQHGTPRAMPAESPRAPFAVPAGEIDLTNHALADQRGRIGFHHLADEFVPRHAAKPVIAALKFEIGVADAAEQKTDQRESLRALRVETPSESRRRHRRETQIACAFGRRLHEHGERGLGALHGAIESVPFHRFAAGFADQAQQLSSAKRL
jgi:hypothetical protein